MKSDIYVISPIRHVHCGGDVNLCQSIGKEAEDGARSSIDRDLDQTKQAVERQDGEILVESAEGHGATTVKLPLRTDVERTTVWGS